MKAKRLLSLLAIAALVMGLVACKDKKSSSSTSSTSGTKKYFKIEGANYVSSSFPQSTSDVELDVNMNSSVLAGGSNYVTVSSPVAAQKVLVGVSGVSGYYEVPTEVRGYDKNRIEYDFIMIINQNLTADEFTVTVAILDENGDISQTYDVTMEIIVAGTGRLQVSLSFDTPKDVDLHLFEPNGYHIYYGDRQSYNGGELDVDSNAGCSIDNINNENIFYGDNAYVEPGLYTVYVDMWENCNQEYPTNFVLTVLYEGQPLIDPIAGHFPADEPSNYNNLDNITPVCTFTIPDNGQTPPAKSVKKELPKFLRSLEKMQ